MINEELNRMRNLAGLNEGVQNLYLLIDTLTNAMEHQESAKDFAQEMHSATGADKHKLEKMFDAYWELGAKDRMRYGDSEWTKFIKLHLK